MRRRLPGRRPRYQRAGLLRVLSHVGPGGVILLRAAATTLKDLLTLDLG